MSARGATSDRDGVLVTGSVTLLGDGSVTQRPAVWRSPGPDGPWTRTDLPGEGSLGEAHAAACDDTGRCTVVGAVDGTLRGWTVGADGSVSALGLPGLAVGEHDLLVAPLLDGGEPTVVLASGGLLRVLTVGGDGIREATGPPARAGALGGPHAASATTSCSRTPGPAAWSLPLVRVAIGPPPGWAPCLTRLA